MLVKSARPAVIPFVPRRKADGTGYELIIPDDISDTLQGGDKVAVATQMNRAIERAVMMAPEQYMWLHRRFKTRPEGQPDRYARKNRSSPQSELSLPAICRIGRVSSSNTGGGCRCAPPFIKSAPLVRITASTLSGCKI